MSPEAVLCQQAHIAIAPRGSGVPGMSAPGAGEGDSSSQCAIAPRGIYGRSEQVGARSQHRGRGIAPRASRRAGTVLTSDSPWQCSHLGCSSQSQRCRCHHGCT